MKYKYDVVSIIDEIGIYKTNKLKNGNKMCPYLFATRKDLLMKYRDIDWGPHLPHSETLGLLTEAMLNDGIIPYEWEEDKSNILFDGIHLDTIWRNPEKGKNLGYYHVRSGTVPAVLLAWRSSPEHRHTYEEYIKNQPKSEYLRQIAWFYEMTDANKEVWMLRPTIHEMLEEMNVSYEQWLDYHTKFRKYHGLL